MENSWPGSKGDPTIGKARPSEASLPYRYKLGYTIRVDNEVNVNPLVDYHSQRRIREARTVRVSDEPERGVYIRLRTNLGTRSRKFRNGSQFQVRRNITFPGFIRTVS